MAVENTIYKSISNQDLLFGLPRNITWATFLFFVCLYLLSLSLLSIVPIIIIYFLLIWAYRKDPIFLNAVFGHLSQKDFYLANQFNITDSRKEGSLADLCPWGMLILPSVVLNKNASFMKIYKFINHDYSAKTDSEIQTITNKFNNYIKRLGVGWAVYIHTRKRVGQGICTKHEFSCLAGQLIEEERIELVEQANTYINEGIISFVYQPAVSVFSVKASRLFVSGKDQKSSDEYMEYLRYFQKQLEVVEEQLSDAFLEFKALHGQGLKTYLHSTISNNKHPIQEGMSPLIDLCDQDFQGGFFPKVGDQHLAVVSVKNFEPGLLNNLQNLPFPYDCIQRYVAAENPLKKAEKLTGRWFSRGRSLMSYFQEAFFSEQFTESRPDSFALEMSDNADAVTAAISNDEFSLGYYTLTILLRDKDKVGVERMAKEVQALLSRCGFIPIIETMNAVTAFQGSLTGNYLINKRNYLITSRNYSSLIPATPWQGQKENNHLNGPPLFHAKSEGGTLYSFVHHIHVVGHLLLFRLSG